MYLCQIERHRFIKYINHDTTNVWQLIQMYSIRCIVINHTSQKHVECYILFGYSHNNKQSMRELTGTPQKLLRGANVLGEGAHKVPCGPVTGHHDHLTPRGLGFSDPDLLTGLPNHLSEMTLKESEGYLRLFIVYFQNLTARSWSKPTSRKSNSS